MYRLTLVAQKATRELISSMQARGLLRAIQPSAGALATPEGQQLVERLESGRDESGPWQLLSVACHRTRLDHLTAHSDAESWLYFSALPACKPLLYVVATCPLDAFQAKASTGKLSPADLIVLEIRPNDPTTSFFTVPGGIPHDELTYAGPGVGPVFFVPEPSRMTHTKVDLSAYQITIAEAAAQ